MPFGAKVFAVEDTVAQLVWRGCPPGPIEIELRAGAASRSFGAFSDHPAGSIVLDELAPDTGYEVTVRPKGASATRSSFRTLASLGGPELFRFATASDIHVGEQRFGLLPRIPTDPVGSLHAAIDAWSAWGAGEVFLKGDLVDHGTEEEWQSFISAHSRIPQRSHIMLGNHEVMKKQRRNPHEMLHAIGHPTDAVRVLDRPALRIVLADTVIEDRGHGRVRAPADVTDAVADADRPCLVMLHHYVQSLPVPTFWPPGISSRSGNTFLRSLRRANPRVAVTAGHSHRNRRRQIAGVDHVEVGSVKDFPGVWAGYTVHESGIRQVSYRVATPGALALTDRTRRVMLGAWRFYAPGSLADRCFNISWSG